MQSEPARSTLYYDGACPLCSAEIDIYRRCDRLGALTFVDASAPGAPLPSEMTPEQALGRFHVLTEGGRLVSGAEAFAEVWARLPRWRLAARLASLPGALAVLERAYRLFLPIRPLLSRLVGALDRRKAA